MPSRSSPSIGRAPSPGRRPDGVDVYLFPAVVGGGLGDIDEVLCAGTFLSRAGFPVVLYRGRGRAVPTGVEGPWSWPPYRRVSRLLPRSRSALTITPAWGVSAAPESPGPLGRAGPWAAEAAAVEAAYGTERTLHVSLEEFARTLSSDREASERLREGGVLSREIRPRLRNETGRGEREEFRRAFRRFRAFDRPNVAHFFAGFGRSVRFEREFPEAIQTGPLWPIWAASRRGIRTVRPRWVWYASPASAEAIADGVVNGLRDASVGARLTVRTPRDWTISLPDDVAEVVAQAWSPARWHRRFAEADLRVVTGSRTLLEALALGGPFLYFNGVLARGSRRRRHRPEKIDAFLALARRRAWPEPLLRDLGDFARGRRVREIVRRAARREGPWRSFPPTPFVDGYPVDRRDLGGLLVAVARALGRPGSSATELVGRLRTGSPL